MLRKQNPAMAPKSAKRAGQNLPADEIKRFKAALDYRRAEEGVSELGQRYKTASHEEKRNILEQYAKDSSMQWRFEFNKRISDEVASLGKTTSKWMTKKAIAVAEGLNLDKEEDRDELDLLLTSYRKRPHEVKALADKGVFQFQRKEKEDIEEEVHREQMEIKAEVAGMEAKPKAASKAKAKALPRAGDGPLVVDWGVAVGKLKKTAKMSIGTANRLLARTQQFKCEASPTGKEALKEASGLLTAAVDGLNDVIQSCENTEADHANLQGLNQNMVETVETYLKLLEQELPKAVPKAKPKAKGKAETKNVEAEAAGGDK